MVKDILKFYSYFNLDSYILRNSEKENINEGNILYVRPILRDNEILCYVAEMSEDFEDGNEDWYLEYYKIMHLETLGIIEEYNENLKLNFVISKDKFKRLKKLGWRYYITPNREYYERFVRKN